VDWRLPTGTPILASRAGVVAAVAAHFVKGGLDAKFRPRANFVAVQHADGTYARYFHLRHLSVFVKAGDRVGVGQPLGLSGNTGFSSTPHLHFDVVDILPEDTCVFQVVGMGGPLPAVAAAFSAVLPSGPPMRMALVRADPPDAHIPLINAAAVKGKAVFIDRGGCSFTTKVRHAVMAEVACIVVANSQEGPELFSMGGTESPLAIPAVLISAESGVLVRAHLALAATPTSGDGEAAGGAGAVEILVASSEGYRKAAAARGPAAAAAAAAAPAAPPAVTLGVQGVQVLPASSASVYGGDGGELLYIAKTVPIAFTQLPAGLAVPTQAKAGAGATFVPQEGVLYPTGGPVDDWGSAKTSKQKGTAAAGVRERSACDPCCSLQ
jgi:hypothetical protein